MAIVVLDDYRLPVDWSGQGLDWRNPDPGDIGYALAIREAIAERGSVADVSFLKRYSPLSIDYWSNVRSALYSLAGGFIDMEYDYDSEYGDFPKYHEYGKLNHLQNCRICELPSHGSFRNDAKLKTFIRNARNYINKLHCKTASVSSRKSISGSVHTGEPTSANSAIWAALTENNKKPSEGNYSSITRIATLIYGPDHGWDEGTYCAEVSEYGNFECRNNFNFSFELNIIALTPGKEDNYFFDPMGTNFNFGINKIGVVKPNEVFSVPGSDNLPKGGSNGFSPQREKAIIIGYMTKAFADFAVAGGYRFKK